MLKLFLLTVLLW